MDILNQITNALIKGEDEEVFELTKGAIQESIPPKDILDKGLIAGMDVIGEQFRKREIFLPDVLLAAKAMYAGMDQLKPLLVKDAIPTMGKIVIGTVQGDLHDIGKNLVGIMLKGTGFDVIDLGKDISAAKFVEVAEKEKASLIGMSALLTTTMPVMKEVASIIKQKGLQGRIKTLVGGAPLSNEFAEEIQADAYGFDAANAVDLAKRLVASH